MGLKWRCHFDTKDVSNDMWFCGMAEGRVNTSPTLALLPPPGHRWLLHPPSLGGRGTNTSVLADWCSGDKRDPLKSKCYLHIPSWNKTNGGRDKGLWE